jgi:hypothetical protein
MSLVELVDKVVDPIPSSVDPTLPSENETQAIDPFLVIKLILKLENATQVVDLIFPSIDPTLPLERKPNTAHIFLIDTTSTIMGGIPRSPMEPPPSNEAILFDWGALPGPHILSHIYFKITVQVYGRDIPQTLIDEGSSFSILSSITLQALGYSQLVPVTKNLLSFKIRTSHPLGFLP